MQSGFPFRTDPRFEEDEVEYKLRLSHNLQNARSALLRGDSEWAQLLERALRSGDNNIITWRLRPELYERIASEGGEFLPVVWAERGSVADRFEAIDAWLQGSQLGSPGAQLSIGSTLLMALGGTDFPPIRTRVFNKAFVLVGREKFRRADKAASRYMRAIEFLDEMVDLAPDVGLPIRHRLDAQGVVWCVMGGWKDVPPIPAVDGSERAAAELVASEAGSDALRATEREAIVQARLGQGLFRDRLIEMWGGCAVTGCMDPKLLRASHIKPWRQSNNVERLSKYNGLLLTPTLDAALDAGLISFNGDGRMLIASRLKRTDRLAAGVSARDRLRFVLPQHRDYLEFHRGTVFMGG